MFLLDTNVVSELSRQRPDASVGAWMLAAPQDLLYLSVITVTELRFGIERHTDPVRRATLQTWLARELPRWADRGLLPVTKPIAERAATFMAQRESAGKPLAIADALIAATASQHGFAIATRNTRDFIDLQLTLIDPWQQPFSLLNP